MVPVGDDGKVIHSGVKDSRTEEEIVGVRYVGMPSKIRGNKNFNFSEESFFKVNECDIDPIIFVRLSQAIDSSIPLPLIQPEVVYK